MLLGPSLLLSLLPPAPGPGDLLVRAERLIVRPGHELEDVQVLVLDGVIASVGSGLVAPEGAEVVEGEVVCAGFLDPWSVLGVDRESVLDPRTTAATRTSDAVDAYGDVRLREVALRAGVTAARVQAGARSRMSGIGTVVRVDPGREPGAGVVLEEACVGAALGLTSSGQEVDVFDRISEVDRLVSDLKKGAERLREVAVYERELAKWEKEIAEKEEELEKDFKKAKKDREKELEKAEEKGKEHKEKRYKEDRKPRPPKPDPDAEIMARVAQGELPLLVEVHRAEEIRELLDGTEELELLRLVLAGATEALPYADRLAERGIPVIVWPSAWGASRLDEFDGQGPGLGAELAAAGVEVLLGSGGRDPAASGDLPLLASLAVGHGLDPARAFEAVTLGPARALDVADRLGSIERGKEAELLVLDGDPLDPATRVEYVVSGGAVVVRP